MAIAKRRFLVSGAVYLVLDVPQLVVIGLYARTMVTAGLRPSSTAIFSALCSCCGPVYMVIKVGGWLAGGGWRCGPHATRRGLEMCTRVCVTLINDGSHDDT